MQAHRPILRQLNQLVRRKMPPNPYLKSSPLESSLAEHLQLHQAHVIDMNVINLPEIAYWIEMVPSANNEDAHYRCKICNGFFENKNLHDQPNSRLRKSIMSPQGVLHNVMEKNSREFINHLNDNVHSDSEVYIKECAGQQDLRKALFQSTRNLYPPQERHLISSYNAFRIAMQWIQTGSAFSQYNSMMNHYRDLGVSVGLFFQNSVGVKRILKSVSEDLHAELIRNIKLRRPLTLMIDGYLNIFCHLISFIIMFPILRM